MQKGDEFKFGPFNSQSHGYRVNTLYRNQPSFDFTALQFADKNSDGQIIGNIL